MEASEILSLLKKHGKVTDEDIKEVVGIEPSMVQLVNTLHGQFCEAQHDDECRFYLESETENEWDLPDHKKWLKVAERVIKYSEASSIEDIKRSLASVSADYMSKPVSQLIFYASYLLGIAPVLNIIDYEGEQALSESSSPE